MDQGMEFFQRQLSEMEGKVERAHSLAQQAFNDISAHEKICVERYTNINAKLTVIPKIFDKLESLQKIANLFLGGLMLAATGFIGVMVAIIVFISKS